MSKQQHTPGPWIDADYGWIDNSKGVSVLKYAGCGSHEAECPNPADRALMLAAPELLEACEAAEWNSLDLPEHVVAKLRAAIARARGES